MINPKPFDAAVPSLGSVTRTPEPKIPKPVMPFVPPHSNLKSKTVKVSKSPRPTVGFFVCR